MNPNIALYDFNKCLSDSALNDESSNNFQREYSQYMKKLNEVKNLKDKISTKYTADHDDSTKLEIIPIGNSTQQHIQPVTSSSGAIEQNAYSINNFTPMAKLGSGTFGSVYLVEE